MTRPDEQHLARTEHPALTILPPMAAATESTSGPGEMDEKEDNGAATNDFCI